jgi:DNA replication and repair protein RecF
MYIKKITLCNFRNFNFAEVIFPERINYILGYNGQGKTNLLESLYICALTKSFRKGDESNWIQDGESRANIKANIVAGGIDKDVEVTIGHECQKTITMNGKKINTRREYIGTLRTVIFTPDDIQLIKGDSSYRRRFMDVALSQTDKNYLFNLMELTRVVRHRNQLLKNIKISRSKPYEIWPWDEQLIKLSQKIAEARLHFIRELEKNLNRTKQYNGPNGSEHMQIIYQRKLLDGDEIDSLQEDIFKSKLEKIRGLEIKNGTTLIGPHRDDLDIQINGKSMRYFASQGQQRSAVINLKLAELKYFEDNGDLPVLLLDDFISELDEARQDWLISILPRKNQIIITATNQFRQHIKTEGSIIDIERKKENVCI